MKPYNKTANNILDIAEHLTQTRGFNAFSYKDIQEQLGIKTSSIHYYFPNKHNLALAMTERYITNFYNKLNDLKTQQKNAICLLKGLGKIYIKVVKQNKFCLCGMMASDLLTLTSDLKNKLEAFFDFIKCWIIDAIKHAKDQKMIKNSIDETTTACLFLAALEGAMLISRTYQNTEYLELAIDQLIEQIRT